MLENEERNEKAEEEIQSPTEKLEKNTPPGNSIPGAENEESVEIKNEVKPNTE